jgi:hypothetical protein
VCFTRVVSFEQRHVLRRGDDHRAVERDLLSQRLLGLGEGTGMAGGSER